MSFMRTLSIGAAALSAQRSRMEVVSSNLANARTTRTPEGGPYRRKLVVFVADPVRADGADSFGRALRTVRVLRIVDDPAPPLQRYEPGHPDAGPDGLVAYPNVDPVSEMVDMLSATRSYEAGVTLVRSVREMTDAALQIIA
jgi:flagellar basal-body rod protein FlgC